MKAMCEYFAVSRAADYEWIKKLEGPAPDQERMEQVQTAYEASHRTYEYRCITLQVEMGHGGDLYSYSTRLDLSVHHQGLVRWLALSLGMSFHRTIPLSW